MVILRVLTFYEFINKADNSHVGVHLVYTHSFTQNQYLKEVTLPPVDFRGLP